jgi:hypothetical protein
MSFPPISKREADETLLRNFLRDTIGLSISIRVALQRHRDRYRVF